MPYEDDEEWATSSGLPIDGFRGTVENVEFTINHQIGPNVVVARFEVVNTEGEKVEQDFSVGSNHQPNQDGTELEGKAPFSDVSNFGRLINSALAIFKAGNLSPKEEIGNPRVGKNWIGSEWTFKTVEVQSGRPGEDAKTTRRRPVFAAYHGKGGTAIDVTVATAEPKTTTSKAKAKDQPNVDPELWNELVELAKSCSDHKEFVGKALDLDAVEHGGREVQKLVASDGKGSVWAAR